MKAGQLIVCVLLCAAPGAKAQTNGVRPCDESVQYEHRNMVDYTVNVRSVKGTVIDMSNVPLPNACIAVFNADHSRLLRTVESDAAGTFVVAGISAGRYWLVVKDQQRAFCPVAARLEVKRWRSNRELVVHMIPGTIDRCSFCEVR